MRVAHSPPVRRRMMQHEDRNIMRKLPEHEVRKRLRPLRVVVSQSERREIEGHAAVPCRLRG